jgi:hypothetical protein
MGIEARYYFKNIPGEFYVRSDWTLMSLVAAQDLTAMVFYDADSEFFWRQPLESEREGVMRAIDLDECGAFGSDGREVWTRALVDEWLKRELPGRVGMLEGLRRGRRDDAARYWRGDSGCIDGEAVARALAYYASGRARESVMAFGETLDV